MRSNTKPRAYAREVSPAQGDAGRKFLVSHGHLLATYDAQPGKFQDVLNQLRNPKLPKTRAEELAYELSALVDCYCIPDEGNLLSNLKDKFVLLRVAVLGKHALEMDKNTRAILAGALAVWAHAKEDLESLRLLFTDTDAQVRVTAFKSLGTHTLYAPLSEGTITLALDLLKTGPWFSNGNPLDEPVDDEADGIRVEGYGAWYSALNILIWSGPAGCVEGERLVREALADRPVILKMRLREGHATICRGLIEGLQDGGVQRMLAGDEDEEKPEPQN